MSDLLQPEEMLSAQIKQLKLAWHAYLPDEQQAIEVWEQTCDRTWSYMSDLVRCWEQAQQQLEQADNWGRFAGHVLKLKYCSCRSDNWFECEFVTNEVSTAHRLANYLSDLYEYSLLDLSSGEEHTTQVWFAGARLSESKQIVPCIHPLFHSGWLTEGEGIKLISDPDFYEPMQPGWRVLEYQLPQDWRG